MVPTIRSHRREVQQRGPDVDQVHPTRYPLLTLWSSPGYTGQPEIAESHL
jgi:hypothetical protein